MKFVICVQDFRRFVVFVDVYDLWFAENWVVKLSSFLKVKSVWNAVV